jgi:RNA polymerase sigma factor (sigma-70 family)
VRQPPDLVEMPGGLGQPERSEPLARRVTAVLDRLPEQYRRVLKLQFLHDDSIQETAQETGITAENAKVIQHRALAKAVQVGERLL